MLLATWLPPSHTGWHWSLLGTTVLQPPELLLLQNKNKRNKSMWANNKPKRWWVWWSTMDNNQQQTRKTTRTMTTTMRTDNNGYNIQWYHIRPDQNKSCWRKGGGLHFIHSTNNSGLANWVLRFRANSRSDQSAPCPWYPWWGMSMTIKIYPWWGMMTACRRHHKW